MIREAHIKDAAAIAAIYNHYVDHSIITFAEVHLASSDIEEQIQSHFPWYIWEENGEIMGYAHASAFKSRCAYKSSVESTIYLHPSHTAKGIGYRLYKHLLEELKRQEYHTVIGGVSLPNAASVALHEKLGYQKVAHYKEVGYKFNKYIDVGYWQLIF